MLFAVYLLVNRGILRVLVSICLVSLTFRLFFFWVRSSGGMIPGEENLCFSIMIICGFGG